MNEQLPLEVYIDLLPNQPKDDRTREQFRGLLRDGFEKNLPNAVERLWNLPPMIVKLRGEYLTLLLETRNIYVEGHFYLCVAMCGIVCERLVKDAFRASVLVKRAGSPRAPSDAAFDQLERVEVKGIIRFLKETEILSADAARAAERLGELRTSMPTLVANPHSKTRSRRSSFCTPSSRTPFLCSRSSKSRREFSYRGLLGSNPERGFSCMPWG